VVGGFQKEQRIGEKIFRRPALAWDYLIESTKQA
jgi:hypothetical protein